jgi:competence protein ComEA
MFARSRTVTALVMVIALAAVAAAAPSRAAAPAAAKSAAADAKPVDINTAGAPELESVPGIGKSLAQRILAFREKNGAFATVDDLLKVQGIGEKSLQHLRPYLTVSKAK